MTKRSYEDNERNAKALAERLTSSGVVGVKTSGGVVMYPVAGSLVILNVKTVTDFETTEAVPVQA